MSTHCPSCHTPISWIKLRRKFLCPHCGCKLSANTGRASAIAIGIWIVVDIPIRLATYGIFDQYFFVGVIVRGLLIGMAGWAIFFVVFDNFCDISNADPD